MIRRPPSAKRTDTLFCYPTRVLSTAPKRGAPSREFPANRAASRPPHALASRPTAAPQSPIRNARFGFAPPPRIEARACDTVNLSAVGRRMGLARRLEWARPRIALRSEENTSELQSIMRISYAVFCLKQTHKHAIHTNKEEH